MVSEAPQPNAKHIKCPVNGCRKYPLAPSEKQTYLILTDEEALVGLAALVEEKKPWRALFGEEAMVGLAARSVTAYNNSKTQLQGSQGWPRCTAVVGDIKTSILIYRSLLTFSPDSSLIYAQSKNT